MLDEGMASPHYERRAWDHTTAQTTSPTLRGSSQGTASPLTPRLISPAGHAHLATPELSVPRLGFGLQGIFPVEDESDSTPTATEPTKGFQLGASLASFFANQNDSAFAASKQRVVHSPSQRLATGPHVSNVFRTRHLFQPVIETDVSDEDYGSDTSDFSSSGDETYINASKPSTPETGAPITPSPPDAKSFSPPSFVVFKRFDPYSSQPSRVNTGNTPVIDHEPAPWKTSPFSALHEQPVTPSPKNASECLYGQSSLEQSSQQTAIELGFGDLLNSKPSPRQSVQNGQSVNSTPTSVKVQSGYASLVAAGPSIGDFSRLLNANLGNLQSTRHEVAKPRLQPPPVLTPRERKWESLEKKLGRLITKDSESDRNAPVHVYVDMSNIHIGFIDSWKLAHNVPVTQRIKAPKFSFENLARILSRDRVVKERFLAGSVAFPATRRSNWPKHMKDAAAMGFAMKIMERVLKEKSPAKPKIASHIHDTVYSFATTSADDSTEDNAPSFVPSRNGEQGVDEGLHVEMLTTIIDHKAGTMVLATGDGAEAEFSQGFKRYAERAMRRGWNVEVCAWRRTISSAWSDPDFLAEWNDQLRIIHLDPYLDELVAEA